jgi:hypothetical protein
VKKIVYLFLTLAVLQSPIAFGADFISKYVENAKILYADNGYKIVQEKIFEIGDLDKGNNKITYVLEPGEYFVQLVTEPCFKINVAVKVPAFGEQNGIISEKPEMRSAIAVFDVPEPEGKSTYITEIKLNGPTPAFCTDAKARVLVYKHIPE